MVPDANILGLRCCEPEWRAREGFGEWRKVYGSPIPPSSAVDSSESSSASAAVSGLDSGFFCLAISGCLGFLPLQSGMTAIYS